MIKIFYFFIRLGKYIRFYYLFIKMKKFLIYVYAVLFAVAGFGLVTA